MAQTLEQRRRNAKFAKTQEARMGKSEDQLKSKTKQIQKSPISMFWMAILGFIIFGGLIFEGPISILRLKRGNQTLYGKR